MVYTTLALTNKLQRLGYAVTALIVAGAVLPDTAMPSVAAAGTPSRVRSSDRAILALLREGDERSATFRRLIDAIEHSTGIVYVEFGFCGFGHLNGCLLPFVASSHGDRYLRVVVTPDKNRQSHDQLLALIGHELRHALEVIDHEEVVDVETMEAMYRKIGTPITGSHRGYETSAARTAGDAVLSDLSRNAQPRQNAHTVSPERVPPTPTQHDHGERTDQRLDESPRLVNRQHSLSDGATGPK